MVNKTFTALFETYPAAAEAVTRLEAAGIPHDDLAIVSNDPAHRDAAAPPDEHTGTATGASLGTLLGGGAGLLAGLGMLAIPGLGPVVAAGWLASTLVGAGVGAAAGGIVGALTDVGISEEDAHVYAEGIHRGGTLVSVKADESLEAQITGILYKRGTMNPNASVANGYDGGWAGSYDGDSVASTNPMIPPPAAPKTAADLPTGFRHGISRMGETMRDEAAMVEDRFANPHAQPPAKAKPAIPTSDEADEPGRAKIRAYDTTI